MRFCVKEWESITLDSWVLQTVKGLKIPVTDIPIQYKEPTPFNLSRKQSLALSGVIDKLFSQGVVELSSEENGQVISNVFLRPKPNNKYRLILDLSQFNTEFVEYQHFKMTNLKMALDLVRPDMFLTSIDLSDAYFTVPIHEECRKYLKFRWKGQLFQFAALPNGLACAPRLFTKLMNPVFTFFRKKGWSCFQYIDDSIIMDDSFEKCQKITQKIVKKLTKLGFFIHETKSSFVPSQQLTFLGFVIDSAEMTVYPTKEKREKINRAGSQLLLAERPSIREVAGFVGLAGSYSIASEFGANHSKQLELARNKALAVSKGDFDSRMFLSDKAKMDILWWLKNVHCLQRKFAQVRWDFTMSTDASMLGWGVTSPWGNTNGRWSEEEKTLHINVLEAKAILFALECFVKQRGLAVRILSDNTTAVSYVNKKGGVHSPKCLEISQRIWDYAERLDLRLCAAHIPGKHNYLADMYSRHFKDNTEWELNQDLFVKIEEEWGIFDIDLFASRLNKKCTKFVSWKPDPASCYIDAFTFTWNFKFAYAFPPFCLVSRVWQKMMSDPTNGVLVAPYWPSQPWFATVNKAARQVLLFPRRRGNLVHPCTSLREDPIATTPIIAFRF